MLLLLLNYVVFVIIIIIIIIIHVKREIRPYHRQRTLPFLLSRNEFERVEHKKTRSWLFYRI